MQFSYERIFTMARIDEIYTGKIEIPCLNVGATSRHIKEILDYNHISNRDLVSLLGVTTQAVSGWRNGKYVPREENLKFLSMISGVSLDDIYVFDMREICFR